MANKQTASPAEAAPIPVPTQAPAVTGETVGELAENIPARAAYDIEQDNKPVPKKYKKKNWFARHKVLTVLLVLLIAVVAVIAYRMNKAKAAGATSVYQFVRTTTLKKTSLDDTVTATGTVAASETASVTVSDSAKLYKVTEVLVKVGDKVKAGDVIANLDTTDVLESIDKAKLSYSDTLTAAQTSYTRAQDDYNTAVVEHQNKLIDLQTKITEAQDALTKAQDKQTEAQNEYDGAKDAYDRIKSAYDTAQGQISTFQAAYDAALTNQTNALNDLNNAILDYQNAVAAYQGGTLDEAGLVAKAQDMINAYHLYNGNVEQMSAAGAGAVSGGNTANVEALKVQLQGYGVSEGSAAVLSDGGMEYVNSAVGICEAAAKNLSDAQANVSNTALGYANLTEMETALKTADTTKTQAETALEQAKTSTETAEKSVTTAKQNYDTENTSTTLKQKNQSIEDAATKLEQAKRTPDNLTTLQTTLQNCVLTATTSGTITALNATVGSVCTGAVATIEDVDGLAVKITISADKVADVKVGMPCSITADTTDETITGTLTQIDPVANDQGTFGAEVTVAGTDSGLLVGTSAQVDIIKSQNANVFTVPIDAIGTAEDGSSYVLRQTGGEGVNMTFEEVPVTTGTANDYYIEISGDTIAEGDVIRSSSDLTQGIESSENTEDTMSAMMGGGLSVEPADDGGGQNRGNRGGTGGGTPPSGGAPGGM